MKKHLIFILLAVLVSSKVLAISISVDSYPFEDSQYRYFLGISTPQDSESKAIKEAEENAYFSAIAEVHGTEIEVSQRSTSKMQDTDFSKVSIFKTESIKFKKFEKISQKSSESNFQFVGKVLFRYDKFEIIEERKRLIEEKNRKIAVKIETEFESNLNNPLEAETSPQTGKLEFRTFANGLEVIGASVEIDQVKLSSTPLIFTSRFSVGEHKIKIMHPLFEDYVESFWVDRSNSQYFNINLRYANGSIAFKSNPSEAKVFLDGNYFGETPIIIETISTEKAITIEIKQNGYYDQVLKGVSLKKDERLIINSILKKKNITDSEGELNKLVDNQNKNSKKGFESGGKICTTSDLEDPAYQNNTCEDRD